MKKFALLAGDKYYPDRGINDLVGFYDSEIEARQHYVEGSSICRQYGWGQIVNTETWEITEEMFG